MARIRTIKPDFWTDEKVVVLSPFARLLFIGMWNFVDDDGRAPLSPSRLKMQILPADPADASALIGEIRGSGLIAVYEVGGKEYFQVNGFSRHQKVDKRTPSKHPPPPSPAEFPRIVPTEGKGREGKEDAAKGAAPENSQTADAEVYQRGKQVLGTNAGGLIKRLIAAKDGNLALARSAIEVASTKQNPREYIGGILNKNATETQSWESAVL